MQTTGIKPNLSFGGKFRVPNNPEILKAVRHEINQKGCKVLGKAQAGENIILNTSSSRKQDQQILAACLGKNLDIAAA